MRKRRPRLTVLTVGVLNAYIEYYKKNGHTPSIRSLAAEVELTSTPIYRHISKLQALGILIPIVHSDIKFVINTGLFYPLRRIAFQKEEYKQQRSESLAKYFLEDIEIPTELTYAHAKDAHMIGKNKQTYYKQK